MRIYICFIHLSIYQWANHVIFFHFSTSHQEVLFERAQFVRNHKASDYQRIIGLLYDLCNFGTIFSVTSTRWLHCNAFFFPPHWTTIVYQASSIISASNLDCVPIDVSICRNQFRFATKMWTQNKIRYICFLYIHSVQS